MYKKLCKLIKENIELSLLTMSLIFMVIVGFMDSLMLGFGFISLSFFILSIVILGSKFVVAYFLARNEVKR